MYVVGKFEILREVESMRGCDVSVRLEVVHRSGVTGEPETTEEFGNDVQGNFDIGDGHNDTARNTENHSEENYTVW